MATTIYALAHNLNSGELDSNDDLTLDFSASFYRNVDGTVTMEAGSVQVTIDPNAALETIRDAITDALVAYAQSAYGWTLPRTHALMTPLQKGLPI